MDRTKIAERVKQLEGLRAEQRQALAEARAQAAQADRNLVLIDGGLQDCEFWLSQLPPEAPAPEAPREILPFPGVPEAPEAPAAG